jgi:hypothetical protein
LYNETVLFALDLKKILKGKEEDGSQKGSCEGESGRAADSRAGSVGIGREGRQGGSDTSGELRVVPGEGGGVLVSGGSRSEREGHRVGLEGSNSNDTVHGSSVPVATIGHGKSCASSVVSSLHVEVGRACSIKAIDGNLEDGSGSAVGEGGGLSVDLDAVNPEGGAASTNGDESGSGSKPLGVVGELEDSSGNIDVTESVGRVCLEIEPVVEGSVSGHAEVEGGVGDEEEGVEERGSVSQIHDCSKVAKGDDEPLPLGVHVELHGHVEGEGRSGSEAAGDGQTRGRCSLEARTRVESGVVQLDGADEDECLGQSSIESDSGLNPGSGGGDKGEGSSEQEVREGRVLQGGDRNGSQSNVSRGSEGASKNGEVAQEEEASAGDGVDGDGAGVIHAKDDLGIHDDVGIAVDDEGVSPDLHDGVGVVGVEPVGAKGHHSEAVGRGRSDPAKGDILCELQLSLAGDGGVDNWGNGSSELEDASGSSGKTQGESSAQHVVAVVLEEGLDEESGGSGSSISQESSSVEDDSIHEAGGLSSLDVQIEVERSGASDVESSKGDGVGPGPGRVDHPTSRDDLEVVGGRGGNDGTGRNDDSQHGDSATGEDEGEAGVLDCEYISVVEAKSDGLGESDVLGEGQSVVEGERARTSEDAGVRDGEGRVEDDICVVDPVGGNAESRSVGNGEGKAALNSDGVGREGDQGGDSEGAAQSKGGSSVSDGNGGLDSIGALESVISGAEGELSNSHEGRIVEDQGLGGENVGSGTCSIQQGILGIDDSGSAEAGSSGEADGDNAVEDESCRRVHDQAVSEGESVVGSLISESESLGRTLGGNGGNSSCEIDVIVPGGVGAEEHAVSLDGGSSGIVDGDSRSEEHVSAKDHVTQGGYSSDSSQLGGRAGEGQSLAGH